MREVADAISRHIELLSAVAAMLVMKGSMVLAAVMMLSACTKDGDTIYQWDPDEPTASTAPTVTVIYGKDALGDHSYNDLIYQWELKRTIVMTVETSAESSVASSAESSVASSPAKHSSTLTPP